jgi:NTP pyrophosphatase (non-canonical NTP hydrolase)
MLKISEKQSLVLNEALKSFGLKNQITKTIEELTELSLKLQHGNERGFDNSDIQEECADVFVCLWHIIQNFGLDEIQQNVDFKIDRLRLTLLDKLNILELQN